MQCRAKEGVHKLTVLRMPAHAKARAVLRMPAHAKARTVLRMPVHAKARTPAALQVLANHLLVHIPLCRCCKPGEWFKQALPQEV